MMEKKKLLKKVTEKKKNTKFSEFRKLVEAYGFKLERISGSHHIFSRHDISELLNIQNKNGKAKPYQIDQFINIIEKYGLE